MSSKTILSAAREMFTRRILSQNSSRNCHLWMSKSEGTVSQLSAWQLHVQSMFRRMNGGLDKLSMIFAQQCHAVVAQRMRRAFRIVELCKKLGYDHKAIAERLRQSFSRRRCDQPFYVMFGAAIFAWEKEKITEEELKLCVSEIQSLPEDSSERLPHVEFLPGWEKVIDRDNLVAWRNPIQGTQLYEYKVFGTFHDITPRSYYQVQTDLDYRKQWDSGVIELEVVDADQNTGCEVVRWIHNFPYPMYSREYIYMRKSVVDPEQGVMLLMSHAVEHPSYPNNPNYVRVSTYQSNIIIKPHTSFDEAGFDYILTYSDDPQTNFPGGCFKYLASSAVPDLVERLRVAAKTLDDRKYSCNDGERLKAMA